MKKLAALILLLLLSLIPLGNRLNAQTQDQKLYPVFTAPDPFSAVAGIAPMQKISPDEAGTLPYYFKENPYASSAWHPLMLYTYMHKIDGQNLFYSPDIVFNKANSKKEVVFEKNETFMLFAGFSFICFIILLYLTYISNKNKDSLFKQTVLLGASLLFFRWGTIFINMFFMGHAMLYPTDEISYYKIANDILNTNFTDKWNMTIGLAFFYMPFVVLTDAKNYFDIVHYFSYFNSFVIGTLLIITVFVIVLKLSGNRLKAYITSLLLCLIPLFYFPAEIHADKIFKAVFALCHYTNTSFRTYYLLNWLGYNGLSDSISTLLILFCVALCLYFKRINLIFIVSCIFALACLVRINNILFAPLLAYLFWRILVDAKTTNLRDIVKYAFISMLLFLFVFTPQFIFNKIMHGGFFTFPYILHPNRAAEGFASDHVIQGINYLVSCNYIFFAPAAVFLLFMKGGFTKNLLVLWTIPLLIFFTGYPCLETNPVRFILPVYGAFIAICLLADAGIDKLREKLIFFGIIAVNLLCCAPVHRFETVMPFDMQVTASWSLVNNVLVYAVPAISLLLCLFLLKANRGLLLFLLVYHIGNPYLVFTLLLFPLVIVLYDIFKEIKFINTGVSYNGENEA